MDRVEIVGRFDAIAAAADRVQRILTSALESLGDPCQAEGLILRARKKAMEIYDLGNDAETDLDL